MDDIEIESGDFDDEKSKSQLKREMLELQEIGVALIKLPRDKLASIPMSEKLYDAIVEADNIKKHGAIRRHMQFIGKLMRNDDSEAIVAAYEKIQQQARNEARKFQQVEDWRDELIIGGKETLARFLEHHPMANRQQLNQLIRNCQKDVSQQKNLGSRKKLFRFLRELLVEGQGEN